MGTSSRPASSPHSHGGSKPDTGHRHQVHGRHNASPAPGFPGGTRPRTEHEEPRETTRNRSLCCRRRDSLTDQERTRNLAQPAQDPPGPSPGPWLPPSSAGASHTRFPAGKRSVHLCLEAGAAFPRPLSARSSGSPCPHSGDVTRRPRPPSQPLQALTSRGSTSGEGATTLAGLRQRTNHRDLFAGQR